MYTLKAEIKKIHTYTLEMCCQHALTVIKLLGTHLTILSTPLDTSCRAVYLKQSLALLLCVQSVWSVHTHLASAASHSLSPFSPAAHFDHIILEQVKNNVFFDMLVKFIELLTQCRPASRSQK